MNGFGRIRSIAAVICNLIICLVVISSAQGQDLRDGIYEVGKLKPMDSRLKVKVGDVAPDFTLPAVAGDKIYLSRFRGRNVVLSFVPAAWTPVCSDQWPGYNIAKDLFDKHQAVLLGITVDNIPTLYAWTKAMGRLWFPVLSDFWPHGAVADKYGVLRLDGMTERALFVIDKKGVIRYIDVHDINVRPDLGVLAEEMDKLPHD
ncbi:MAG: peroxiredoxin [Deltaproteobacteria bacterium]|nr:peroxiredoxin [Deltaproteobacteria bacterium]MBF0524932.1 peroxiredoxin [Deltaproteobacteria bacterium]